MKLNNNNHLCYCFNVFDKENASPLNDTFINTIETLKKKLNVEKQPFAAGLWLNRENLDKILSPASQLKLRSRLEKHNLYVFTFNAFPYGNFHGSKVKEQVYLPDWREDERLTYTMETADLLSEILPEGIEGSISTVPGGYKDFIQKNDLAKIAANIFRINSHLEKIKKEKGKIIRLAIEFEPDCLWESADEFIGYKNKYLNALDAVDNFIGICYDCAHADTINADIREDIAKLEKANTKIAKFQLSAALKCKLPEGKQILAKFADDVYLHQSSLINTSGLVSRYKDLPLLLESEEANGEIISHFHLPIFFEDSSDSYLAASKRNLLSVAGMISDGTIKDSHLEIETYTYSVLPQHFFYHKVEEFISMEYAWLLRKISEKT